ncbi:hypothetical protein [Schleiferilactobacillus harbinensis]|uniref:hypothetical protein n=1 Tax=Schleiferilactobacillus harbinensis TaxID=304207 RepID=UPI00186ABEDC
MRQSQKTGIKLGRQETGKNLEGFDTTGVCSTVSGEDKMQDGISFQGKALSRKNLNEAYKRVKCNKGAAGVDGMSIDEFLPYMQEHRTEFVESLGRETYKPARSSG